MTKNTLRKIIAASTWSFAKSMPQIPHCYTSRKNAPSDDDFVAFAAVIRSHGYDERFFSRSYRYLDIDGWQYWTMGNHPEATTIINRARLNREGRPIMKNPVPFVCSIPFTEFYCKDSKQMIPVQPNLNLDTHEQNPE